MEKFEFQAETRELLDLMIHAIYSNKEIFLRELISNSSDALDKIKFASLTDESLSEAVADLHIRLEADRDERTLTVWDNGIGMSRDEVVQYIGTIAKSGSKEFLAMLKENKGDVPPELIGQFGVGLYSAFMVADEVSLLTRKAGEENATIWKSSGDGTYTVDDAEREGYGTEITLKLKPVDREDGIRDYTKEWVVKDLVKKYSDYVAHPIIMKIEQSEMKRDDEGEAYEEKSYEDETLNSMKAIWRRSPEDVTDEEYTEFYKHISHDWNEPLKHIFYKAEGTVEFRSLLFLPKKAPADLFNQPDGESRNGISLYIKRVFIMQDCADLIPTYMRFLRGIVDSEDLSLNISREMLQQDRMIRLIRNRLTSKVLDTLQEMKNKENELFLEFWQEFGSIFKEGIVQETKNKEKLLDICLFNSTYGSELVSLPDYIDRMQEGQEFIYYMTGTTREAVENSPHLEAYKAKGYEVLVLTEAIDEVWAETIFEYKDLKFKCVGKGVAELGSKEEQEEARHALEEKEETYGPLLKFIAASLEDEVKEVRLSTRLTESPVCLVGEQSDITPQMEALLRKMGKDVPKIKRILELNGDHQMLVHLKTMFDVNSDDPELKGLCQLLYGQALLAEGTMPSDPGSFSKQIGKLMTLALGCQNINESKSGDVN